MAGRGIALFFIFWLSGVISLNAQQQVPRGLLIQLKSGADPAVFRERMGISSDRWKEVDKGFRIYSIQSMTAEAEEKLFSDIVNSGKCQFWQHLNKVESRSVMPNDPFFVQQKYLMRTQVPDVWPYQRNGLDRQGDTLVVAIIDSGMDTLHPDLLKNAWANHGEIPANKIDDDSNGYVDDYRGWNGADENPRTYTKVTLDGHGTGIAGIIGAEGNNGTGIAGMNWKIKVMPVVCYPEMGFGSDIGVVRSLIYVYRMKKLYLESGGQRGANIVALNTSIGIDLAKPEDAPLWCAMYDSLGAVGILSSAATTNNNYDVGVKGDIPSTCPSKYMLVASSTDANDNWGNRGFSTVFVDLATQGEQVFTTLLLKDAGSNGPYGTHDGTSFAAPQISGTTALIYQHACDTFLALAKNQPDSAVKLMTSWIMQGTDKLSVLNNKCVSGGRLNVFKTWQLMDQWCTARDLPYSTGAPEGMMGSLFPNPVEAGSEVILTVNRTIDKALIRITEVNGKLISELRFEDQKEFVIPGSALSPGTYFIQLYTPEGQLVKKLQVL